MNPGTEQLLFAVSVAASALGGMLGIASGIFIVPILTIFAHVDIRIAIGASILSVIACSCSSAAPFLKSRLTNVRLAIVLEMATTAGALSGVVLAGAIPTSYLFLLFGAILVPRANGASHRHTACHCRNRFVHSTADPKGNSHVYYLPEGPRLSICSCRCRCPVNYICRLCHRRPV